MLNESPVNIFFNPELDKKMVRDGFIILPFLGPNEITNFENLYNKWHCEQPTAFFKSYFDPRMDYKQEVENKIIQVFQEKMKTVFRDYNAFGGLFVVKPPSQEGHLPPHQDWSFVDERKHWSINMWCPLEDVDSDNGNMIVLKGSHQFNRTIRGVGTPDVYRDHWKLIENNMQSVPLKAGEAIFFFHGLLHGSTLNTTPKSRVSIGLTLTPKYAPHYFHYMEKGTNILERFSTNPDFYIEYASKRGARPESESQKDSFKFDPIQENKLINDIRTAQGYVKQFKNEKTTNGWLKKIKTSILKK